MKHQVAHASRQAVLAIGLLVATIALAADWSDPQLLNTTGTTDGYPDGGPVLLRDAAGTRHAVWISAAELSGSGQDWDLFHATDAGSGWSDPILLNSNATTDIGSDTHPAILQDASGTLHAVWQSDENLGGTAGTDKDIFHSSNSGTGWSAPVLLNAFGTVDDEPDEVPSIAMDAAGNLVVAWYSFADTAGAGNDADILYSTNGGAGWSVPALLNTNGASDFGSDYYPCLARDAAGTVHAVWYSYEDLHGSGNDGDVFYASYTGSGWTAPTLVNTNGTSDTGMDQVPRILAGADGVLHVTWTSEEDLGGTAGTDLDLFYSRNAGSGWSDPVLVNTYGNGDDAWDEGCRLVQDAGGTLHAAWYSLYDLNGTAGIDWDILYATHDGSGWSSASLLNRNGQGDTGYDNSVALLESPPGVLLAAWQSTEDLAGDLGDDDDVLYAELTLPTPTPGPPTPTAVWYELDMPILELHPTDLFRLLVHTGNPTTAHLDVDEYIVLDVYSEYWFWPDWTQDLDGWTGTIPALTSWDTTILEFVWPSGAGSATGIKFWGAYLDQGTIDLIILDSIEWGYAEP